MSHKQQMGFVASVKSKYPQYFSNVKVLEIGSLNINGSVRQFFTDCEYVGVDLGEGKDVDVVAKAEELKYKAKSFDTVISCECLEHNAKWAETFNNMARIAKSLVVMTCATTGRAEHGTSRTSPADAPFSNDYYMNLTEQDIRDKCDLSKFKEYGFATNDTPADLYFWGIK